MKGKKGLRSNDCIININLEVYGIAQKEKYKKEKEKYKELIKEYKKEKKDEDLQTAETNLAVASIKYKNYKKYGSYNSLPTDTWALGMILLRMMKPFRVPPPPDSKSPNELDDLWKTINRGPGTQKWVLKLLQDTLSDTGVSWLRYLALTELLSKVLCSNKMRTISMKEFSDELEKIPNTLYKSLPDSLRPEC